MEEENHRQGRKRLLVTTSILLALILGVPIWRKITEVYRSHVPFARIKEQSQNVSSHPLALPCSLHVIFVQSRDGAQAPPLLDWDARIRQEVGASLCGGGGFQLLLSIDSLLGCRGGGGDEGLVLWPCGLAQLGSKEGLSDEEVDELLWKYVSSSRQSDMCGKYTILVLEEGNGEAVENRMSKATAVIGKHRHAWISGVDDVSSNHDVVALVAEIARAYFDHGVFVGMDAGKISSVRSMPLAADGSVVLSFSLLNAEPKDWIFVWDFKEVEKRFLEPVVAALAPIGTMSIESQVLYYTPKAVSSAWDVKLGSHVISPADLPFFVNAKEWHLDSSTAAVGQSKLLHFVIYIPAADECPLQIKHRNGKLSSIGFISHGWGGVTIWSPPKCETSERNVPHYLLAKDMRPIMEAVISQLRNLFGLASLTFNNTTRVHHVPAVTTGIADWEVDLLLRRRIARDEFAAAATLTSLSKLVQSLPNMVIKDEIGDQVSSSLEAANAARAHAARGSYVATGDAARKARALAEDAFFQPSFMSLLYFPLEHHVAIYTPFFVPVLFHVAIAFLKEIRRYCRKKKQLRAQ